MILKNHCEDKIFAAGWGIQKNCSLVNLVCIEHPLAWPGSKLTVAKCTVWGFKVFCDNSHYCLYILFLGMVVFGVCVCVYICWERGREKKMKKTEEEKRKKYYTKGQLFKHLSGISQPYRIHSSVKSPAWCPDTYSLSVQNLCLRPPLSSHSGPIDLLSYLVLSFLTPCAHRNRVSLSLSLFFFFFFAVK